MLQIISLKTFISHFQQSESSYKKFGVLTTKFLSVVALSIILHENVTFCELSTIPFDFKFEKIKLLSDSS